ncbi:hypothetical protein VDGD_02421 [Verticillium dahliae]|nr:hypothetical protein VdG1_00197 [Verticillium dahliae VDG1]RBQ86389.1 hypothetical protein VDGD_02421 [Verticillium dahliae]
MAEVIGIVAVAAQSTKALYDTVQSFRDQPRAVRQMQEELASLDGVLGSLRDAVQEEETFFVPLKLPLRQCSQACNEFRALVIKCTTHSDGARPSVRDWVRLRYMDTDIRGFTEMLGVYKSTISVALADAILRSSKITRAALDEYKVMINATAQDLENHLEEINAKLRALAPLSGLLPALPPEDRRWFERERRSTEQCLDICAQGLARLDELMLRSLPDAERSNESNQTHKLAQEFTLAEIMTLLALRRCRDELAFHLHSKEGQAERYLPRGAPADTAFQHDAWGLAAQSESTEQCLAILPHAAEQAASSGVHVVEDVDIGVDGEQMLITSRDQLFEVRRVNLGNRARQVVMSSTSEAVREFLQSQK